MSAGRVHTPDLPFLTDFHAHILPAADHGSDGIPTSLAQLRLLQSAGISRVVATPHFYPDKTTVEAFLSRREAALTHLADALQGEIAVPEILAGAEVLLVEGLDEMGGLSRLCIPGSRVLLLELPLRQLSLGLLDTVERLSDHSELQIVLAHIERYPAKVIDSLLELPLLAQINFPALLRSFGKARYLHLLDSRRLVAIGSDIHGTPPKLDAQFRKAMQKLGPARLQSLMAETDRLLAGAECAIPKRPL